MEIYEPKATLEITCRLAKFTRSAEIIGKQDPYVKFTIGEKLYKTDVHEDGGKEPLWEHTFIHTVQNIHEDILIEAFDQDMGEDDLIGFCQIKVSSLMANSDKEKGMTDWYSLFFNNERVGLLLLNSKLLPSKNGKKAFTKLERTMTTEQELEQAKYES